MADQKPLNRMICYLGMKMETLELRYSDPPEGETPRRWRTEFAETEWKILDETVKTLTLVQAFEPEVREVFRRRLQGRKFNGGRNATQSKARTAGDDMAEAEGG